MTPKEAFIQCMDETLRDCPDFFGQDEIADLAMKYYKSLKNAPVKESKIITDNGTIIVKFVQAHRDIYNNIFTAKSLGEAVGLGSKVVSGAMRKLVTDGFFEKVGANPVSYSITEKGMNFSQFDN